MEPDDLDTNITLQNGSLATPGNRVFNYYGHVPSDFIDYKEITSAYEGGQKSMSLYDFIRDQIPIEDRTTMMVEWEEGELRGVIPDDAVLRKWNTEYRATHENGSPAPGTLVKLREFVYEVYRIQATQVFTTQL